MKANLCKRVSKLRMMNVLFSTIMSKAHTAGKTKYLLTTQLWKTFTHYKNTCRRFKVKTQIMISHKSPLKLVLLDNDRPSYSNMCFTNFITNRYLGINSTCGIKLKSNAKVTTTNALFTCFILITQVHMPWYSYS